MPCSNRDWQLELSSLQELSRRWCTGSSGTGAARPSAQLQLSPSNGFQELSRPASLNIKEVTWKVKAGLSAEAHDA
jgi:hypothetical protein